MMRLRGGGGEDPYLIPEIGYGHISNRVTAGLALRSQTINPAARTLVDITIGQSNGSNISPTAYVSPYAAAIDNLNPYDGAIYAAKDPLLGCDLNPNLPGNHSMRLAHLTLAGGYADRVILVPMCIDASDVAFWQGPLARPRLSVIMRRLAARGITTGPNVRIIIRFIEGEGDSVGLTSQANFVAGTRAIFDVMRAAGAQGPFFVPLQTYYTGVISPTIRAAQAQLVDYLANVWEGPDADVLIGSACNGQACRQTDDLHWSDAGSQSYAEAWLAKLISSGVAFNWGV